LQAVGHAARAPLLRRAPGEARTRARRPAGPAPPALVRLPRGPRHDRVLVRRRVPPARPRRLRTPRRPLAEAQAVSVNPMGPQRIVCLTEEPTETLYLLGEQQRIVGISGFTVRPPQARREKPKVSAFLSARIDRILELQPDLAIGFSDIQADIAQALIKAGVEVWIANHRSVEGILDYVRRLAAMVGRPSEGQALAASLEAGLGLIARQALSLPRRPKVYFEEWDEPRIPAIRWVAELIRIAGGDDIFPERAACSLAKDRILADDHE